MKRLQTIVLALAALSAELHAAVSDDRYHLSVDADHSVRVEVAGMPAQRLAAEFTVLWSETDPLCQRNASHPNYVVAPRTAVRWRQSNETIEELNAWLASPAMKSATGMNGSVAAEPKGRTWEFRDPQGKVKVRVTGERGLDTTRPFQVGRRVAMRPVRSAETGRRLTWEYEPQESFTLTAELSLPSGEADLELTFMLTPRRDGFFSVAHTGAPALPLEETLPVPQECSARGHRQFDFVMSEADLHLPRAHAATRDLNIALVADPRECRFRLPTMADSRFGFMLSADGGQLRPVLLAPLLGGPESRMRAGTPWRFTSRCVIRPGDWKDSYVHIARGLHGFRDERDNSGPGSLNGALARVLDFLADRRGGNRALWDEQQKYADYFTDKTGVFKPFSPLYGLSAAIVADDEELFRHRARPAVEYALSRRTSVFAPYEAADNRQANSAGRAVGAPYLGYVQLATLHQLFQERSPVLLALAEGKGAAKERIADALARWRLTGEAGALGEARAAGGKMSGANAIHSEADFFDLLDLAEATGDAEHVRLAREAAYHQAAKLNLYPAPPAQNVTADRGGVAPVHFHSFGRHRNIWGFPPPQPAPVPEQHVPAWRIARTGLPGLAYPIEYWMNTHGALMRTAALAQDGFLRDLARWGMVGRFGNYPGDNRSQDSLVAEQPSAVEAPPWAWNFATVNPGHAWDFAGAVLDFLVSDAFERSRGAIDFPALSAAGSSFRVRIYGAQAGRFYGDENVRPWLPSSLITSENRQLDWLAGYGNGHLYLAFWNQSFREENATIALDPALVECDGARPVRQWRDNQPAAPPRVAGNRLLVTVAPKGIVALAIPATVKPRLLARLYDSSSPALPRQSFTWLEAPFGKVHAMLLRAGRGLTTAFVYTEALPENVISARLHWRQGEGAWQRQTDAIYPYEFSPELNDEGGAFQAILEIENAQQTVLRSSTIRLALKEPQGPLAAPSPPPSTAEAQPAPSSVAPLPELPASISADFVSYLQGAANGHDFGRRADGRYYPYSTPEGRRIAWRQPVWDKTLYAVGCTPEEAERHLRVALRRTLAELQAFLSAQQPPVDFANLDLRQQETLLDLAYTEGIAQLPPAAVSAVLTQDWNRLISQHLYVRYAGHAPDHARNKAFAERWKIR